MTHTEKQKKEINDAIRYGGHKKIIYNPSPERINKILSGRERIGLNTAIFIEKLKY